ncbi:MAG: hydroxymethylbilane synthase [Gammaproteobacteria bacterium]|nr:hydroxymethylbilane synthase [Gammaproteobacteria bacterium]
MESIRIATRSSPLAVWQARHVAERLEAAHDGLSCELVEMTTEGDRFLAAPLSEIGGKGLFIKELEQAMLDGRADIAVHSMKDLTVELPPGFALPAILARGNPLDAVVSNRYADLADLPMGARVGSSSLRRRCQLGAMRPDLAVSPIRGNVQTRLGKLDAQDFDALILACAGLERLGLGERVRESLPADTMLPAIGQGALGVECREEDQRVLGLLAALDDGDAHQCVGAERALNRVLAGGCHAPVAGFATLDGPLIELRALVGSLDGSTIINASVSGPREQWNELGEQAANVLIEQGAFELLADAMK